MSKESPPSRSPSLGTVASVARRQLPAERGRRGVVEDEVESRSRGPRHSWSTTGTGELYLLHTASTHAHAGEWQSWRGQARRPDEAMPCTEGVRRARAQVKDAGRVLTSSWQRAPLDSPPRGRSSRQRPPRTRRREEASSAMVPPRNICKVGVYIGEKGESHGVRLARGGRQTGGHGTRRRPNEPKWSTDP